MEPETSVCLSLAIRALPKEWELPRDWDIKVKTGAYVHFHREELTIVGQEQGFTHLMMIDADLMFPANGINRLIDKNADIAFASYNRKNRDYRERLKYPAGFMLVNLEAAKKLEVPRFRCEFGSGEDVYFFAMAQRAGLTIWRDDTIEIGHIGKRVY